MGFRSTFISEHYSAELPAWFKEKYTNTIICIDGTLIASKCESKIYGNEIFEDYQRALVESEFWKDGSKITVAVAVMGEDEVITKVILSKDDIKYFVMSEAYDDDHVWQQGY